MPSLFYAKSPVVLASASPRRQSFLQELGIDFFVMQANGAEPLPYEGEVPHLYAQRAALAKAHMVADNCRDCVIIAADTVVTLYDGEDAKIFGKPKDEVHALAMLEILSGKKHSVITAVSLILPSGEEITFYDSTDVIFYPWKRDILLPYAYCGEPLDKAGAYAIQGQGSFLVESIHGSWSTVVGLPVNILVEKLLQYNLIEPVKVVT